MNISVFVYLTVGTVNREIARIDVPTVFFFDLKPRFNGSVKVNSLKRSRAEERISSDEGQRTAIYKIYGFKRGAVGESHIIYACNALGDQYCLKGSTPGEGFLTDARYGITRGGFRRDDNACIGTGADTADIAGAVTVGGEVKTYGGRFGKRIKRGISGLVCACN